MTALPKTAYHALARPARAARSRAEHMLRALRAAVKRTKLFKRDAAGDPGSALEAWTYRLEAMEHALHVAELAARDALECSRCHGTGQAKAITRVEARSGRDALRITRGLRPCAACGGRGVLR
jgi:hypothetical protein